MAGAPITRRFSEMKLAPNARAARWIVALAFAGTVSLGPITAIAGEDDPYPSPVTTTSDMLSTLGVFVQGAAMGMTAVW